MTEQFNPANVPIGYTLNYQQVNLLLEGLGKLPFERVEALYNALRSQAVQVLQAHEQEIARRATEAQAAAAPEGPAND